MFLFDEEMTMNEQNKQLHMHIYTPCACGPLIHCDLEENSEKERNTITLPWIMRKILVPAL